MMRKDIKRTFFELIPYECGAAEEYLEDMAQKGWLLQSVKGTILKFKKIEPRKLKYSVDVLHKVSAFDHKDSDAALEFREHRKAKGWNYVCEKGKIQIFYADYDEDIVSNPTDEYEKYKSVLKASSSLILGQAFLTLIFLFNLYMQLFKGSSEYILSSNLSLISVIAMSSIIIINTIEFVRFVFWYVKSKRQLEENNVITYSNYKQVRLKNLFRVIYGLILLVILSSILIFNNYGGRALKISSILMVLTPIIIIAAVQKLVNIKKYSKNVNILLTIISTLVSIFLILTLLAPISFKSIAQSKKNERPVDKVSLSITDFGYKESDNTSPYMWTDKSILAQRIQYHSSVNGIHNLDYTILHSNYPWAIKFHENRLLRDFNKYGGELKKGEFNLSNEITVYSDSKRRSFVLVSKDKVVCIRRFVGVISNEELLNLVYKKLF